MKETGGSIIHIVSSSAKGISPNKAPYGAAKAGLAHFIHYAAAEGAEMGIRVNGITPTYVFTPRHELEINEKAAATGTNQDEIAAGLVAGQLIKEQMVPEDLLGTVDLLLEARAITGQVIDVTFGETFT
jgi:NAD(P)-dependent dehydrogenase (short-subunit alcohol dehydrogenase family)